MSYATAIARVGASSPSGKVFESERPRGSLSLRSFYLIDASSVLVDYLSQNNLGELLRLAETLASKFKARD